MPDIAKELNANHTEVVNFKNPFTQSSVYYINLNYSKKLFENYFVWQGRVSFKNGNTKGDQDFENKELPVILKEIETFVKSLEI